MTTRTQDWRAKRLILHIGAPRTGTSSIQSMLRQNRANLLQQGVLYPETLQRVFVAAMAPAWPSDAQQRRIGITGLRAIQGLRRSLAKTLHREVNEHRPETIIISAEQLFDRLDKGTVRRRLKQWLSAFAERIEVLVYLRRQDQAIFSRHLNAIRLGRSETWVVPDRISKLYDYQRRLKLWVNLFGKDAVTVRAYQRQDFPEGSGVLDFLAQAGIDPAPLIPPQREHNASLDVIKAEFMTRITDHISPAEDPDSFRNDLNWVIDRVRGDWSRSTLPMRDAQAILDLYREPNTRLSRDWSQGREFFDTTIASEPPPSASLEIDDVIEIAAQLWTLKADQVRNLKRTVSRLKENIRPGE